VVRPVFAPKCPVDDRERDWVDKSVEWFRGQFGDSPLEAPVILPTRECFPRPPPACDADVRALVRKVPGYMAVRRGETDPPWEKVPRSRPPRLSQAGPALPWLAVVRVNFVRTPAICLSHRDACSGRPARPAGQSGDRSARSGDRLAARRRNVRARRSSGGRRQDCQLPLVMVQRPVDLYFVIAPPEPHCAELHGAHIASGDRASGQRAQPERAVDPVDELIHLDHVVSGADPSPAEPAARLRSHHACALHDGPAQFQSERSPAADVGPGRQNRLRAEPGAEQWQPYRQMLTYPAVGIQRLKFTHACCA
jgi:hypothetical protein